MAQTNWDNIISKDELPKYVKKRNKTYIEKTGWKSSLEDDQSEGWEYVSDYSGKSKSGGQKIKLHKEKPFDEQFEDEVWMMFYKMGFFYLNKDRNFTIYEAKDGSPFSQQIDVFAADEDTVLIIECKAAQTRKSATFKKPIEALGGNMQRIRNEVYSRPEFKDKKLKFIWATKNINLDSNDIKRLEDYGIAYFDDDAVRYYTKLADHLSSAARYQLLGDIFKNSEIKNMDMDIPAIKGKMGGFEYYSFSIEPEKLLKIGYVLHHSMAISGQMQTYQRLIKKQRLTQIRSFINNGGYFPNSIIVSIDTNGRQLQFDEASAKSNSSLYKLGVLHLPKRYHSAYIIDGQHRLYGYSDSKYASTNAIPVIAFVNLSEEDQMRLFMEINENQKAVPKTLRVVLNGDLLWNDKQKSKQRDALRSKIAQQLGADNTSPLHGRIILAEDDESTDDRCITVAALQGALKNTSFFSEFDSKNALTKNGTYDTGDVESTYSRLYPVLRDMLQYISSHTEEEWERGKNGILTMNRGVQGCIRLISDIVDYLCSEGKLNPLKDNTDIVYPEIEFYLDSFIKYINQISEERRTDLLKYKGTGGDRQFWRQFQNAIHKEHDEFNPEGLEQYLEDEMQRYNQTSLNYLNKIEVRLKDIAEEKLRDKYGATWDSSGIPKNIYQKIEKSRSDREYNISTGKESGPVPDRWEFVTIQDIQPIVTYSSNWTGLFEDIMTRPEEAKIAGGKAAKTEWILTLSKEKIKLTGSSGSTYSVKKDVFNMIEAVYQWLCVEDENGASDT